MLERRQQGEAPTEVLGRAMILVQQVADEIISEAKAEAAAIVASASEAAPTARFSPTPIPTPVAAATPADDVVLAQLGERMEAIRAAIAAVAPPPAPGVTDPAWRPTAERNEGEPGPGPVDEEHGGDGRADEEPSDEAVVEGLSTSAEPDAGAPSPGGSPGRPSWVRADRTNDRGDVDYFAALRQALDDDEPLGPRDEVAEPEGNGARHLGPLLHWLPVLMAVVGFPSAVGLWPR
jgi:hypothetical protein